MTIKIDSGGILSSLLLALFIGLKLTGYINWSWWWVLAPAWIPVVLVLVILCILAAVAIITGTKLTIRKKG